MGTHYRWKVIAITTDEYHARRSLGKVLGWTMTEEGARDHEQATGRKLEKVPNSG